MSTHAGGTQMSAGLCRCGIALEHRKKYKEGGCRSDFHRDASRGIRSHGKAHLDESVTR